MRSACAALACTIAGSLEQRSRSSDAESEAVEGIKPHGGGILKWSNGVLSRWSSHCGARALLSTYATIHSARWVTKLVAVNCRRR